MKDQELLELVGAAMQKIQDWSFNNFTVHENILVKELGERGGGITSYWSPLSSLGDALWLAVKLKIEFYITDDEGLASYAGYWTDTGIKYCIEYHNALPYCTQKDGDMLATCRAITRAAAEIGKGLK